MTNFNDILNAFFQDKPKKYRNDVIEVKNDIVSWYYYGTAIVEWDRKNTMIKINTNGWYTISTITRINAIKYNLFPYLNEHQNIPNMDVGILKNGKIEFTIDYPTTGFFADENEWIDLKHVFMKYFDRMEKYEKEMKRRSLISKKIKESALKSEYHINNLLAYGNLSIYRDMRRDLTQRPIRLIRKNEDPLNYELHIYDAFLMVIREKAYDTIGNVIWKILVFDIDELRQHLEEVVLIGKDGNQWWMHYLPPYYWLAHIDACERWLLNIDKDTNILMEG